MYSILYLVGFFQTLKMRARQILPNTMRMIMWKLRSSKMFSFGCIFCQFKNKRFSFIIKLVMFLTLVVVCFLAECTKINLPL